VDVYLEAAVGGGIPCIQAINDGLAANRIENLLAIVNGTTNYILTKMDEEGKSFKEALAEAQKKGYAEADPSFDLDGYDAAHKLAILASIAFDQRVCVEDIQVQGIREISRKDIEDAREELGCVIKLLAVAKAHGDDGLELRVAPTLIPKDHPLASVDDVYNAIFVTGDAVGNVMLYGRGAGKLPTASAVISDIIFIGRNLAAGVAGKVPAVAYDVNRVASRRVLGPDEVQGRYFLRFVALDQPGVLAAISGVLADYGISISSVAQKERKKGDKVPVIISTYSAGQKNLMDALATIERLPVIKDKTLVMRLEIPEED
jgi:homoserine dehydrogenase